MDKAEFVVVANRLPWTGRATRTGADAWRRSPGGLVTALEPVMQKADGAWVGWAGQPDVELEPFEFDGTLLVPVTLSAEDVELYYEGFSNDTIWPLYHDVIAEPRYRRVWWDAYVRVNRRFAEAAAEAADDGATVWVQDYQLQLVPRMLRDLRPDLVIGYFHHIPFPAYGLYSQLPWRRQVLEGLLGADVIGFQRVADAGNFARAVRRQLRYETKASGITVPEADGTTRDLAREGVPDLDRRVVVHRARAARGRPGRARRDPREPRQPEADLPRGRPSRLHEGHPPPAQGVRRAADRREAQRRGRHARAGRQPQPRARRRVHPAARRDRADRRAHQRRLRHDGPHGDPLPAPGVPARGDGRALPRGRRHARHRAARRDEPRREGVRRRRASTTAACSSSASSPAPPTSSAPRCG